MEGPTWQWIRALYVDLVGRTPAPQDLDRWITAARCGASHRDIARGVLESNEYCAAQIAALYRSLLDREADPTGLAAWTTSLRSGTTLQDIIAGVCDTFEYKANHPVAAAFVESLYRRLLHRASDADGKAAQLAALRNRASTLSVIRSFLGSTEYCAQRVAELHLRLLGREPDHSDPPERVVALMHGAPLQHVELELVTSSEYIARANPAPITRPIARPCNVARAAAPAARADPDQDALDLVRAGEITEALRRLMDRHGAAVYRYCRAAIDDATLAEDVQQQVFIEAYRDLPSFAQRSTVRTWLLGIARHRVLDAAKRRRRTLARLEDAAVDETPDVRPSTGESLDDARLQAALVASVRELEPPAATAILLRYQQGLTYEEMAEICGENAGTLQARVARALRRLRSRIEERMARPGERRARP